MGMPVAVFAHDDSGKSAHSVVVPLNERESLELALRIDNPLDVYVRAGRAQSFSAAVVQVETRSGMRREIRADSTGRVRISCPDQVRLLRVRAPGCVSAVLEPRSEPGAQMGGAVTVELRRERELALELVDESGSAIRGVQLRFQALRGYSATTGDPELQGSVGTDHPFWARNPRPFLFATTDALGRARALGLEESIAYSCGFELPPWARPDTVVQSAYSRAVPERIVPLDGEFLRWTLPRGVHISFDVENGVDGSPLDGYDVWSVSPSVRLLENAQSRLDLWLSRQETALRLSKEGFDEGIVDLAVSPKGLARLVVQLWPGERARVTFEGDGQQVAGQIIRVCAWRMDAKLGAGATSADMLWSGEVAVDASSTAWLHVPVSERAQLSIDPLRLGNTQVEFVAIDGTWSPGASLKFRATRR